MKIVLRSPFSQSSGYGKDGIGLARALLDRGHDVRISPTFVGVPLPRDIAGLLTYPLDPPFDLAIHHMEPGKVFLDEVDASASRTSVFWSMWEFDSMSSQKWAADFADRVRHFDHVVAYDQGSLGAFAPYVAEDRLHLVQGGFEAEDWGVSRDPHEGTFRFGMNGRLTTRKGVYTAYRVFLRLRETLGEDFDAELILQSTEPIFPVGFPLPERVRVNIAVSSVEDLKSYYQSLDCLVCPSWGEGKNLPALEALACGTPVILSDIPGHRQWATSSEVSWVKTTPHFPLASGLLGNFVDPEDLAQVMHHVYLNRYSERVRAQTAARSISVGMNWSRCVERLGLACNLRL